MLSDFQWTSMGPGIRFSKKAALQVFIHPLSRGRPACLTFFSPRRNPWDAKVATICTSQASRVQRLVTCMAQASPAFSGQANVAASKRTRLLGWEGFGISGQGGGGRRGCIRVHARTGTLIFHP